MALPRLVSATVLVSVGCLPACASSDPLDVGEQNATVANPAIATANVDGDTVLTVKPGNVTALGPIEGYDLEGMRLTVMNPFPGVGDIDFAGARSLCAAMTYGGDTGWRLPTVLEMIALRRLDPRTAPGLAQLASAYVDVGFEEQAASQINRSETLRRCLALTGLAEQMCFAATADSGGYRPGRFDLSTLRVSDPGTSRGPAICVRRPLEKICDACMVVRLDPSGRKSFGQTCRVVDAAGRAPFSNLRQDCQIPESDPGAALTTRCGPCTQVSAASFRRRCEWLNVAGKVVGAIDDALCGPG